MKGKREATQNRLSSGTLLHSKTQYLKVSGIPTGIGNTYRYRKYSFIYVNSKGELIAKASRVVDHQCHPKELATLSMWDFITHSHKLEEVAKSKVSCTSGR